MLLLMCVFLPACAHHPTAPAPQVDPRMEAWVKGSGVAVAPPSVCSELIQPLAMLGRALYERDQAAWHASDAAMGTLKVLVAGGGNGLLEPWWLVESYGDRSVVEWVTSRSGTPEVLVEVDVVTADHHATLRQIEGMADAILDVDGALKSEFTAQALALAARSRPLTELELAQFRAVQLATTQAERPQAERMNVVTLPVNGEWWVYLLPATTSSDVFVLGGAVEVIVKDGVIADVYRHGQNVYTMPLTNPGGLSPIGYLAIPSMQCPSETLVFTSLQYDNLPIVLVGALGMWGIRGAEITYLGAVTP